jgi:hypothetical protein
MAAESIAPPNRPKDSGLDDLTFPCFLSEAAPLQNRENWPNSLGSSAFELRYERRAMRQLKGTLQSSANHRGAGGGKRWSRSPTASSKSARHEAKSPPQSDTLSRLDRGRGKGDVETESATVAEFQAQVTQWAKAHRVRPRQLRLQPMRRKWASCVPQVYGVDTKSWRSR